MAYTLFVHMMNAEPFIADSEELPKPSDQLLICTSPRRRGGKDVDSFLPEVVTVLLQWHRIAFVEVMPTEATEELITFVRE